MTATPPEIRQILAQVEAELSAMLMVGDVGSVTIHCGPGDLLVEVTAKRKHKPVRLERTKHLAVIKTAGR